MGRPCFTIVCTNTGVVMNGVNARCVICAAKLITRQAEHILKMEGSWFREELTKVLDHMDKELNPEILDYAFCIRELISPK